ncbi:MAG: cell division protein FtsL [Acidobacteria bacterium]|nr:cell division protein FtsL [Acidobacteriota bacterium]
MKYKRGNQKKKLVNTEIVRVQDNKKKELIIIFCFIATIFSLVFFYVWQRLANVELAYKIENVKKELKKEEEVNSILKLQYEQLSDLKRVRQLATTQLGMKEPGKNELVTPKPIKLNVDPVTNDELVLTRRDNKKHGEVNR